MGRLPGPFLPPIAMIGPFLDRSPLMGSFGGKSQLPPGGLQKLLRHVLVDQLNMIEVPSGGGDPFLAMSPAIGCASSDPEVLGKLWADGPGWA